MKAENLFSVGHVPKNYTFVAVAKSGIELAFPQESLYGGDIGLGGESEVFSRDDFMGALKIVARPPRSDDEARERARSYMEHNQDLLDILADK